MVDEDKLRELKDRIETAKSSNTPITKKNKESGAGFGFKISTEIIAALVVGVGIGLIVDKYLGRPPHRPKRCASCLLSQMFST